MKFTKKRENWNESMTDVRIRPNLSNLSKKEIKIAKQIWKDIPHYRKASKQLAKYGYYRTANIDFTASLWFLSPNGIVECIGTTTKHRINVMISARKDYYANKINRQIWENYATGGYNTLIGLYRANECENRIKEAERMAKSHADYMGHETDNSTIDHYNRVSLRSV